MARKHGQLPPEPLLRRDIFLVGKIRPTYKILAKKFVFCGYYL